MAQPTKKRPAPTREAPELEVPVAKIKPAAYNPRKDLSPADREYQDIRRSIEHFGLVDPLVWNKRSGNLVGGHQRFKVVQDLGYQRVRVRVVDLGPREERALNVALNKIVGRWDKPKLKDLLVDLDAGDIDFALTGFGPEDIKNLIEPPERTIKSDIGSVLDQTGIKECPTCHRAFRGKKKVGEFIAAGKRGKP